jgi:hypothetical protein
MLSLFLPISGIFPKISIIGDLSGVSIDAVDVQDRDAS